MENTFGKKPVDAPDKTTKRAFPEARPNEQTEPVDSFPKVADEGRLQQSITVGRKPETIRVSPGEVESLRPSASEMKNG